MIRVNDTYEYKTKFTQQDVEAFAELTGDRNPLHINLDFAQKSEYGREIVQGVLIASAFSKVFGTMWPGTHDSIYISQDMMFHAAVFVDEEYLLKFECTNVDETRAIGTIAASLVDKQGKELVTLKARIKSLSQFSAPILN